jgi:hypothetical protein
LVDEHPATKARTSRHTLRQAQNRVEQNDFEKDPRIMVSDNQLGIPIARTDLPDNHSIE